MDRRSVTLTALLLALLPAAARATPTPPSIELLSPADGAVLEGGETVVLEWRPAAPLDPAIVEWEAFLSVDGGRYYAARVTPHLDIDIRRFAIPIPAIALAEVRLLLRFGDEIEEVSADLPQRFSIRNSRLPRPPLRPSHEEVGESARPGDPGVAQWVEGSRRGDGLRLRTGRAAGVRGEVGRLAGRFRPWSLLEPAPPPIPVERARSTTLAPITTGPLTVVATPASRAAPILTLSCRRNR